MIFTASWVKSLYEFMESLYEKRGLLQVGLNYLIDVFGIIHKSIPFS